MWSSEEALFFSLFEILSEKDARFCQWVLLIDLEDHLVPFLLIAFYIILLFEKGSGLYRFPTSASRFLVFNWLVFWMYELLYFWDKPTFQDVVCGLTHGLFILFTTVWEFSRACCLCSQLWFHCGQRRLLFFSGTWMHFDLFRLVLCPQ